MTRKTSDVSLEAFSQKAISKAVRGKALQSPVFLYPSAAGLLALMSLAVVEMSPLVIGLAAGGVGVGALALGWLFLFRRDLISREYLTQMHEMMNSRRQILLKELSSRMQELNFHQGASQLDHLQNKFANFVGILNQTLSPEEITYGRYLGIAEQVYLSSLDNLEQAVGVLTSIRTIDLRHIEGRIEAIHADGIVTDSEAIEQDSLNQRKDLYDKQLNRVAALVAQNEQAMTKLDFTAAAIAEMKTQSGQASMDMESAMTELQNLIEKAPKYNRQF